MIVTVSSDNPNFSFVIGKNPNSLPRALSYRQGVMVGWFTPNNECEYNVRFIDSQDELSFPEYQGQKFEYMNPGRYCNPYIVSSMCSKVFGKPNDTLDKPYYHTAEIRSLRVKERTISSINKYFAGIDFDFVPHDAWPEYYNVSLSGNLSTAAFLTALELSTVLMTCDNDENVFFDNSSIKKYFAMLADYEAPYFLRYMFKCHLLGSFDRWKQVEKDLNRSEINRLDIRQASNMEARMTMLSSFINRVNLVDLGCGEGRYMTRFANSYESYHGIDINPKNIEICKRKAELRGLSNVHFYESIEQFLLQAPVQKHSVVCTEVIEHLDKDDVPDFVSKILRIPQMVQCSITTPNSAFNSNYLLEEGELRHEDHKWEMTSTEFYSFISNMVPSGYTITKMMIGDRVDDQQPTTMLSIRKLYG